MLNIQNYLPKPKKSTSFISSCFAAFIAGSANFYSSYAPQLISKCNLSPKQASTLGIALTLGMSLGGLPLGILIDNLGTEFALFLSSLNFFLGYFLLYYSFKSSSSNLFLLTFSLLIIGLSSIAALYSSTKCCTSNFNKHRATLSGICFSCFGLSPSIFSLISTKLLNNNPQLLLVFLSIFCPIFTFQGIFFMRLLPSPLLYQQTQAQAQAQVQIQNQHTSLLSSKKKNSLQYLTTLELNNNESNITDNTTKKNFRNSHLYKILTSKLFLINYFILAFLHSTGQTYIILIGFIINAQFDSLNYNNININTSSLNQQQTQALQVSILAISIFFGKLSAGFVSDKLYYYFKLQRLWNIVFSSILMLLSQYLLTFINNLDLLTYTSILTGLAFGITFATYPCIIAEYFNSGPNSKFTTIWGTMTTGAFFIVLSISSLFGKIYDKNSIKIINHHGITQKICTKGASCYDTTFYLTSFQCLLALFLSLYAIHYRKTHPNQFKTPVNFFI
ncbi:MFS general substrate transporter [Ascoidea rubescens DSM 1968]|uniref:MFS general substrate transporter n=1 Tax=Ascoidea rubescens DSM 1968 TaxID=1344418 RepID=A0A1D2VNM3_9ASCO|nr:MFS general substrate transporter [Ascoidea rubescens DSM 1968]ODV63208.1 MFS general substrate transporter [Ascoidea rubescens DSM 1968]